MFDSSYARDAPITFPVGTGRVMKVGGRNGSQQSLSALRLIATICVEYPKP